MLRYETSQAAICQCTRRAVPAELSNTASTLAGNDSVYRKERICKNLTMVVQRRCRSLYIRCFMAHASDALLTFLSTCMRNLDTGFKSGVIVFQIPPRHTRRARLGLNSVLSRNEIVGEPGDIRLRADETLRQEANLSLGLPLVPSII